ncbi:MAG TPA: hypothetical protein VMJ93_05775 [Verrucomicrobiae bacterium]|nr:hypothetical protein [Verrucomicrobiae bacterium]
MAAGLLFTLAPAAAESRAWGQGPAGPASTTWTVTIVLPPRLVAGQPATLAVLGTDGKLARGVEVDLGQGARVRTDPIGRAYFTVPTGENYLIAKSQGSSAAALVDQAPSAPANSLAVDARVSLKDTFSICGGGFAGDAEANRVQLRGEPALVLAASPECLVVLASPQTKPGPAAVSVKTPMAERAGETTLVALQYAAPEPPLLAQKKSRLVVTAVGTEDPVRIRIQNESPGVLQFSHGDQQELNTSGGAANQASFEVEAIRSGDYSFQARIVPIADTADAGRYLDAARPLAGENLGKELKKLAQRLKRHPRDAEKVRAELDYILNTVMAGDLRTLLVAARNSL